MTAHENPLWHRGRATRKKPIMMRALHSTHTRRQQCYYFGSTRKLQVLFVAIFQHIDNLRGDIAIIIIKAFLFGHCGSNLFEESFVSLAFHTCHSTLWTRATNFSALVIPALYLDQTVMSELSVQWRMKQLFHSSFSWSLPFDLSSKQDLS